jgi:hypothetical protein
MEMKKEKITKTELAATLAALQSAARQFKFSTSGSYQTPECVALDAASEAAARALALYDYEVSENGR